MIPVQNFIYFIVFIIAGISGKSTGEKTLVTISNGQISGQIKLNWDGEPFYSYTSIPYALPPINELRFKAPVPARPWDGILNATKPSPFCPQFMYYDLVGQEDCLYLNVYTKSINPKAKLPVMVYIHGGAFLLGTGSSLVYGPEFLLTEDIVLVTIEYRLGYLGALSFRNQSNGVPGNAHMKDQVMALKWVQNNIEQFGGDKFSVTVFGESAGGASTHLHMLSPMSKGLMHRAIIQSGCALNPWVTGRLGTGEEAAEIFGIEDCCSEETVKKLQEIPWDEFVRKLQPPGELVVPLNESLVYSPVVETQSNEPAFLTKPAIELIADSPPDIPFLLGYDDNEMIIFDVLTYIYAAKDFVLDDLNATIPWDLDIPDEETRSNILESIKTTFFTDSNNTFAKNHENSLEYGRGAWFLGGYTQTVDQHLAAGNKIYVYRFCSDTRLNYYKRIHPITMTLKGASHMDALGYLFTTDYTVAFNKDSLEDRSWRTLVKTWVNFARYGNPAPENVPLEWKTVQNSGNVVYVNIDGDKLTEQYKPDQKIWDFWKNLYSQYSIYKNLNKT